MPPTQTISNTQTVSSGITDTGWIVSGAQGKLIVALGGKTIGTTLSAGGREVVNSGGNATGTIIKSGSSETVSNGGHAISTFVSSGGAETVLSGGLSIYDTVVPGGALYVYGVATSAKLLGGSAVVFAGGVDSGTVVASGGSEIVSSGGVASGATISLGGAETVSMGGSAVRTVVSSGGTETVLSGGVSINDTVRTGGAEYVYGAASSAALLGGSAVVYAGGVDRGAVVSSGGNEIVSSGGVASGTTISAGGAETVSMGGSAVGTIVSVFGAETVLSGGVSISAAVGPGGALYVYGVASGATLLGGSANVAAGGVDSGTVVSNSGFENISSGGSAVGTTVESGGFEVVSAGGSAAEATISGGGELVLIDSTASATDTTVLPGAMIDVTYLAPDSGGSVTLDSSTDLLTVSAAGGAVEFSMQLAGAYAGEYFHLAPDGSGGTLITEDSTPCYCRGTLILTDRGEVAVEDLAIGDRLVTPEGEAMPIRWIGRRRFDGWLAADNPDIQPICFKAGSIADHVPARDLRVSPEHAMFLDGALIPARHLVNGVSIYPADAMEEVEYFHLELERHAVIFAEGAASESFLDDDSRGMFHNVYDYHRLYPDAPRPVEPEYCAPRVEDGYELETVRRRLIGRAVRLNANGVATPSPALHGNLERVTRTTIEGWAFDPADPQARLSLMILVGGAEIGRVTADRPRPDLAAAGIGDGGHAFRFHLPQGFAADRAHHVEVRRAGDWAPLPGAPATLNAAAEV